MPGVPFCPTGWNFLDRPPYAGQWWALTRHGAVELVDVEHKDPEHFGKTDPLAAEPDPYVYTFGHGSTAFAETVANRRWTHWMPVLPPDPPLDRDPVASGLADPTPGPRLAEFRSDPPHASPGPHFGIDWAAERRKIAEEEKLREVVENVEQELERLDREDASAYKPIDLPPGSDAHVGAGPDPVTPADLVARVKPSAATSPRSAGRPASGSTPA